MAGPWAQMRSALSSLRFYLCNIPLAVQDVAGVLANGVTSIRKFMLGCWREESSWWSKIGFGRNNITLDHQCYIAQPVYMCFMKMEKNYDSPFWYIVRGALVMLSYGLYSTCYSVSVESK